MRFWLLPLIRMMAYRICLSSTEQTPVSQGGCLHMSVQMLYRLGSWARNDVVFRAVRLNIPSSERQSYNILP